jgi:hypothetical protein
VSIKPGAGQTDDGTLSIHALIRFPPNVAKDLSKNCSKPNCGDLDPAVLTSMATCVMYYKIDYELRNKRDVLGFMS